MDARPLAPSKPSRLERLLERCPGQCALCRAWTYGRVCAACLQHWDRPALRCWTCAIRLPLELADRREPRCGRCLRQPPPLDRCIAAIDYAFPWDGLLQRYKFHAALDLRDALLDRLDLALSTGAAEAPDYLLPVPLSAERLRERGYNQSWELARALARRRGIACAADMLVRLRDTAHQLQLPPEQRAANVRQAFAADPRQVSALRGRRVAVLDDVMTTGATLYELARALRQAGVAHVQAWVIARTATPRH